MSPDGRTIAFATDRASANDDDANRDILLIDVDGTDVRPLFVDPGLDTEPALSPDGRRLAFLTTIGENVDVAVMDADGTGFTRLTDDPAETSSRRGAPTARGSRSPAPPPPATTRSG